MGVGQSETGKTRADASFEPPCVAAVEFVNGWAEIGAPPVLALATGYGDIGAAVVFNLDFAQFTSTQPGSVG
jgi:hypothetical protein